MLLLALHYYLTVDGIHAVPIPSTAGFTSSPYSDPEHRRALWNIIWSCIVTIFACTWVAIHPNINVAYSSKSSRGCLRPWFSDERRGLVLKQGMLFAISLLVPEYIFAWALRQYIVAHRIAKSAKSKDWTPTHGFFVIMGGFQLWKRDGPGGTGRPCHPLDIKEVKRLVRAGELQLPTEDEIKDRSKSDWLAKAIVLVQTAWFITQCIAREVEHLPITHLEIVTLAYATLNIGIYVAWWDKPRNVEYPIRVFNMDHEDNERIMSKPASKESARSVLENLMLFIIGDQDYFINLSQRKNVPTFYSGKPDFDQTLFAVAIALVMGIAFGAIHCFAWDFEFPTHIELILWRISSVTLVAVPVIIPFVFYLSGIVSSDEEDPAPPHLVWFAGVSLLALLYTVARITSIAEAFTSLRSLPSGAFETIRWTTFIPHIY